MKKILIYLIVATFLVACGGNEISKTEYLNYISYYNAILDNDKFSSKSEYYNIECSKHTLATDEFRYDVILDSPKVAMYNVEILVVYDDTILNETEMMPSYGIFEDENVNLIPFQAVDEDYPKGVIVSGKTDYDTNEVLVLVLWQDVGNSNTYREYIRLSVKENE